MARTDLSGTTTTDHKTIRAWITERGGRPSVVESTEGRGAGGILRVDFGDTDENLSEISWKSFLAYSMNESWHSSTRIIPPKER